MIKQLALYQQFYDGADSRAVFGRFMASLQPRSTNWDYFIDPKRLDKVLAEVLDLIIYLDQLIGADDITDRFRQLIKNRPEAVKALPYLVGRWQDSSSITIESAATRLHLDFVNCDPQKIEDYCTFFNKSRLKELISQQNIRSLVDYVLGVEVGLGSHRRKNLTGNIMEAICGRKLESFCLNNNYDQPISQVSPDDIYQRWNFDLSHLKGNRRFDFAFSNHLGQLFLIEANFYNSPGSKLKATAGEYRNLCRNLTTSRQIKFIWITDGPGWKKTSRPLFDSFADIDYIINLDLLDRGFLEKICA